MKIKRIFSMFLVVWMVCGTVPMAVFAHDAAIIEPLINVDNLTYSFMSRDETHSLFGESHSEGSIASMKTYFTLDINDTGGGTSNPSTAGFKELGYGGGVFNLFIGTIEKSKDANMQPHQYIQENEGERPSVAKKDNMGDPYILAFPAKSEGSIFAYNPTNAELWDKERASLIASTLNTTANRLIKTALNGINLQNKSDKVASIIAASCLIMPQDESGINDDYTSVSFTAGSQSYGILYFNRPRTASNPVLSIPDSQTKIAFSEVNRYLEASDKNGSLYCYLFELNGSDVTIESVKNYSSGGMVWAMPKGYVGNHAINKANASGWGFVKNNEDAEYITIHMLTFYANVAYVYSGYSIESAPPVQLGFVEAAVAGIFDGMISGVKGALNLYGMDELIFNKGNRGGEIYTSGLMPQQWWSVVLKYFTIFQVIAWMAIGLAIVKSLVQINFGTLASNPVQKAQLMETLLKMFTVGMFLVLCIPILRLMLVVNNTLVDVFATAYTGDIAKTPTSTNVFAQIFLGFYYLLILLFVNFTYIMRGITLAILMAMAPFFVVSMAFFTRGKGLFDNWLKEVAANIFIQSFHAFCFSFLFEAIAFGGSGIENAVILFSIIPLTNFFRQMIFGEAGTFAIKTGQALSNAATSALRGISGSSVGGVAEGVKNFSNARNPMAAAGSRKAEASNGSSGSQGNIAEAIKAPFANAAGKAAAEKVDQKQELTANSHKAGLLNAAGSVAGSATTMGGSLGGVMDIMQGMAFDKEHLMSQGAAKVGQSLGSGMTSMVGTAARPVAHGIANLSNKRRSFQSSDGRTPPMTQLTARDTVSYNHDSQPVVQLDKKGDMYKQFAGLEVGSERYRQVQENCKQQGWEFKNDNGNVTFTGVGFTNSDKKSIPSTVSMGNDKRPVMQNFSQGRALRTPPETNRLVTGTGSSKNESKDQIVTSTPPLRRTETSRPIKPPSNHFPPTRRTAAASKKKGDGS